MSLRLLNAWRRNKPFVHTAVDDLESFLWVLVWALVHILKEFGTTRNSTIDDLAKWLSSYSITEVMARESTIQFRWKDVVFGDLLREWLATSQKARFAIWPHVETVFGLGQDVGSQQNALNQLEECCTSVYMEFIQTGHKHLESIRRYANWTAVVEANPEWLK